MVHYIPTEEKNRTTVSTGVKRHNRKRFRDAVQQQLLYFKDTKFYVKYESDDHWEEQHFQAEILHNSESIIIAQNCHYATPHVVVVKDKESDIGVSYGTIDFQELEMSHMRGSLGFKCPIRSVIEDPETGERKVVQEGITVTPRN